MNFFRFLLVGFPFDIRKAGMPITGMIRRIKTHEHFALSQRFDERAQSENKIPIPLTICASSRYFFSREKEKYV